MSITDDIVDLDIDVSRLILVLTNPNSTDAAILDALARLRKILSEKGSICLDEIVYMHSGLPKLIPLLKHSNSKICLEVCCCLTDILFVDNSRYIELVVEAGAIDPLFVLLDRDTDTDEDIYLYSHSLAVLALIGCQPQYRNILLSKDIVEKVLTILDGPLPLNVYHGVAWITRSLCHYVTDFIHVQKIGVILGWFIYAFQDQGGVVREAVKGLHILSEGHGEARTVMLYRILKRKPHTWEMLISLLLHQDHNTRAPTARFIGTVLTTKDYIVQELIDNGLLLAFNQILSEPILADPCLYREVVKAVSHITSRKLKFLDELIAVRLLKILQDNALSSSLRRRWSDDQTQQDVYDKELKHHIISTFHNATEKQYPKIMRYLAGMGCLDMLVTLFETTSTDPVAQKKVLALIEKFLHFGQTHHRTVQIDKNTKVVKNVYAALFKRAGGVQEFGKLLIPGAGRPNHPALPIIKSLMPILEEESSHIPIETLETTLNEWYDPDEDKCAENEGSDEDEDDYDYDFIDEDEDGEDEDNDEDNMSITSSLISRILSSLISVTASGSIHTSDISSVNTSSINSSNEDEDNEDEDNEHEDDNNSMTTVAELINRMDDEQDNDEQDNYEDNNSMTTVAMHDRDDSSAVEGRAMEDHGHSDGELNPKQHKVFNDDMML